MFTEPILFAFALLFGACIGSFLNVVILRLPNPKQSVIFPASHCPKCLTPLRWFENLPILSYIFLRGKCKHCKVHISLQYPIVELTMALLSAALLFTFGVSYDYLGFFVFTAALLVIIVIDIHHQIIPDLISLPGIVLGFGFSFLNSTITWQSSLIGLLVGGGILYGVAVLYFLIRKIDGMGGGDIKLLAMLGAWLGWQSLPFVIFVSSFTGTIIGLIAMAYQKKGGHTRIPFGPFLSIAALLFMFFSEKILYFLQLYLSGQWP